MHVQRLCSFEYQRERWQNGRGWTREICREGGEDWAWRCSIAEIDHDGPFSLFAGRQRWMTLLQGEGLILRAQDGQAMALEPPHGRLRYSGDLALDASLQAGPCHALNFIWDPTRCSVELLHRPLVGPMVFFADPEQSWLIYVLRGEAHLRDDRRAGIAGTGDSLLLPAGQPGERVLLNGGGELLMFRMSPPAPSPPDEAPATP